MDINQAIAMVHQGTEYQATRSLHQFVTTAKTCNEYSDFMLFAFLALEEEVTFARQVCERDVSDFGYRRSETMQRILDKWNEDIMHFRIDADIAREE